MNDSLSHYSRQSDDMSGMGTGLHSIPNGGAPLDSNTRRKNGSNLNLAGSIQQSKPDKPVKPSKKLPDLKMTGHALDGGSSI